MPDNASNDTDQKPSSSYRESIGHVLDLFVKQIDGLAETLPLAIRVIAEVRTDTVNERNEFLNRECTLDPEDGAYRIPGIKSFEYQRLSGRVRRTRLAYQLVPGSFLVSLVSQFDGFLGRLIRQLFALKPEILNSSENTLTFSQMVAFGSIDAAKEYIVEKEIEAVLRKSHSEQFDWLEKKFGLVLRKNLESWPDFIEVTERRNLFVHANGVVSHQYLEVCANHSCKVEPGTKLGKQLSVNRKYFSGAHDCLLEIGVKLAQVLWRKLSGDDFSEADKSLITICYELLAEWRYRIARRLLDFGVETIKKHSGESRRLTLVVNRAQAYKWSGDEETARRIVNAEDWSALEPKFLLAQAVLLDDFAGATEIMKQIGGEHHQLGALAYREWPLFKEIRKTPEFAAAFEEIFREPLNALKIGDKGTEPSPDETIH